MSQKIKVLVVDDSALMRKLVSNIINKDPEIEVADTAINGLFALKKLKRDDIDIIMLDIEMPGMNGLEFLKMRRELNIDIPVVMLSSLGATKPEITIQALDLGAKDFIVKPSGSISMDIEKVGKEIIAAIKKYGGDKYRTPLDYEKIEKELEKLLEKQKEQTTIAPKINIKEYTSYKENSGEFEKKLSNIEMILIGISTGGPAALRQLFPKIKNQKYPILIVQHMPPGFTLEFAKGLDRLTSLSVSEAKDGETLKKGCAYVAPGDHHLSVLKGTSGYKLRLLDAPTINGHRPSVEVLYESAFKEKIKSLGIIMTGMGKDGAHTLKKLHDNGNPTIAQSPNDCVVFGMPRVAVELGAVDKVLEINDIADFINQL